ncbi:hypothetical protein CFC21_043740 [Triticum aestivum]|uniref:Hypothetical gene predicted by FGENESH n=2 Tax=Triticum aestivum TaxID=4565 RepID=A0A9R1FQD5_WHEAT|nr:hypothetical protein CFC21_043740 [Triticum aestivum]CAP72295.1 unnamed protein product [Triticum aestivum]
MADVEGSGEEVGAPQKQAGAVEASLDGEKPPAVRIDTTTQTDVQCAAESDPPAGTTGKKNRMPAEIVSYILSMPIDKPDIVMPSCLQQGDKNMAEILGVTEEWLEDMRQTYRDVALRTQRVHDDFVKYQVQIRDELFEKGYVEVDDDYFTNHAEFGEEMAAMWEEWEKKRSPTLTFADYSDYNIPYDYEEQARRLVDL